MNSKFVHTSALVAGLLSLGLSTSLSAQETDAQKAAQEAALAIANAPKVEEVAPKPRYWTNSLLTKIDFLQTHLTNWAAGGYNTLSASAFVDANANYKKKDVFVNNRLQMDYGFLYSSDKPFLQKNVDRFYLEIKAGYVATKTLNYSMQFNFKSQFSNAYEYPVPSMPEGEKPHRGDWMAARKLKSGLLSPAYTNVALGIDWVPTKWLTVNLAPVTGGFVITTDELLRKSYGMSRKKAYKDTEKYPETDPEVKDPETGSVISPARFRGDYFRPARFEFGAQLKIDGKLTINDNFSYTSQLVLFSDYLNNPQNIRVNWDNRIDWKLAKYFSLTITTNLIYDDKVLVKTEDHPEGKKAVQFKESVAFGFSYSIASKKK